jgi:hypothetical protein
MTYKAETVAQTYINPLFKILRFYFCKKKYLKLNFCCPKMNEKNKTSFFDFFSRRGSYILFKTLLLKTPVDASCPGDSKYIEFVVVGLILVALFCDKP